MTRYMNLLHEFNGDQGDVKFRQNISYMQFPGGGGGEGVEVLNEVLYGGAPPGARPYPLIY